MIITTQQVKQWLTNFENLIESNKAYLSDLDTPIGDGDHGNNMARGMLAVKETLENKQPEDLASTFKLVAMALISKVGGASGPLYGTAFLEMSKASLKTDDLGILLEVALEGIKKRGGAQAGDKTMVDVWEMLVPQVQNETLNQSDIDEAVKATEEMVAKKGRASYLGERSVGHLDPGAVSSGYLFTALLETEGLS